VKHRASQRFWTSTYDAGRVLGFVMFWTLAIVVTTTHNGTRRAPAYVRAAAVPLGVAALALVVEPLPLDHGAQTPLAAVAVMTLVGVQVAYALGAAWLVPVALGCGFAWLLLVRGRSVSPATRPLAMAVVIALIAGELAARYVSYSVRRVGPIPATAMVAVFRVAAGSLMVAAAYAASSARFADRLLDGGGGAVAVVAALCVQLGFFYVDLWSNSLWRCVHLGAVLALAVSVARWLTRGSRIASRLYPLTVVGVLGLAGLQFAYFYRDYFGR
jgi:hypothetical protein